MKDKKEFYREIDIFSRGIDGFSPYIVDIMRGIEREYGGVEDEFLNYMVEKFKVTKNELVDTSKMLKIKILEVKNSEKKEIKVCLGMHCKANGGDFIFEEFKNLLNIEEDEITKDGKFLLTTQRCFAKCNLGPNVRVGEKFYHKVNIDDVKNIIEENK